MRRAVSLGGLPAEPVHRTFPKPEKRKTTKRRKDRHETEVERAVREACVARDRYCRLDTSGANEPLGLVCSGPSEWAHLGDKKRARTRGMAPEDRHLSSGSLMLCRRMHQLYDAGQLEILPRRKTGAGADGRLSFVWSGKSYSEPW